MFLITCQYSYQFTLVCIYIITFYRVMVDQNSGDQIFTGMIKYSEMTSCLQRSKVHPAFAERTPELNNIYQWDESYLRSTDHNLTCHNGCSSNCFLQPDISTWSRTGQSCFAPTQHTWNAPIHSWGFLCRYNFTLSRSGLWSSYK